MTETPICYLSFKEGNGLRCEQHGRSFTGVPAGVTFAVYPFDSAHGRYRLSAPGYAPGDSGNESDAIIVTLSPDAPA